MIVFFTCIYLLKRIGDSYIRASAEKETFPRQRIKMVSSYYLVLAYLRMPPVLQMPCPKTCFLLQCAVAVPKAGAPWHL